MSAGINREQVLGIMAEMVQHLEQADETLHDSLAGIRERLHIEHSGRMAEFEVYLDQLERKPSRVIYSSHAVNEYSETSSLKLELGF